MSAGSWFRFIVGALLSLDVLRGAFITHQVEVTSVLLAIVFLALTALYLVRRI